MTRAPSIRVRDGVCHVLFAYDLGREIDLGAAARVLSAQPEPPAGPGRPPYLQFPRPPVACEVTTPPVAAPGIGRCDRARVVLYDFGAALLSFEVPANGSLDELAALVRELSATDAFERAARDAARDVIGRLGAAVDQPGLSGVVEDYLVLHVRDAETAVPTSEWTQTFAAPLAAVLRGAAEPLSEQEIAQALSSWASATPHDLTVVDWSAALVLRPRADDLLAVLGFANVQLLEMRFLDARLDADLERSYQAVHETRRRAVAFPAGHRKALEQISRRQIDAALLFEHVRNAPKLLGDQYLARVYEHASARFRLRDWDDGVHRKLEVLAKIYDRVHDRASRTRAEILEWIIIALIAGDIALALLRR